MYFTCFIVSSVFICHYYLLGAGVGGTPLSFSEGTISPFSWLTVIRFSRLETLTITLAERADDVLFASTVMVSVELPLPLVTFVLHHVSVEDAVQLPFEVTVTFCVPPSATNDKDSGLSERLGGAAS